MSKGPSFLARAMSEKGEPSSSRYISVVGLLVMAPGLLIACILKAPEQFGLAFEVWCAVVGGVYVGGKFAGRGQPGMTTTSQSASTVTTATTPPSGS